MAYKPELPPSSAIHPTFHVSQLKAALGVRKQPTEIPLEISAELELLVQPETLRGVGTKTGGSGQDLEVLIQWKGSTDLEATWEDYEKMKNQFPDFYLEDKVKVWHTGVDMPQPFRVYQRKGKRVQGQGWNEMNTNKQPIQDIQG